MDSALGVQLDGKAVKKIAEASKNLLNAESPSAPLVRGRLRPPKPSLRRRQASSSKTSLNDRHALE